MKGAKLLQFDFDGVLHSNHHYAEEFAEVDVRLITEAQERGYAAAIMTCNDLGRVVQALKDHGIDAIPDPYMEFRGWDGGMGGRQVLVTSRKLYARAYIDDRAINYRYGQGTGTVWRALDVMDELEEGEKS